MGMANGAGTGRAVSEINVTPLIDVLLVLLIIFMVIVPVVPKGLEALIPKPPNAQATVTRDGTIVVSVAVGAQGEPSYRINQEVVAKAEIGPRLERIYAGRRDKTMFVTADNSIAFSQVAEMIDLGYQAQVDNIGLLSPRP